MTSPRCLSTGAWASRTSTSGSRRFCAATRRASASLSPAKRAKSRARSKARQGRHERARVTPVPPVRIAYCAPFQYDFGTENHLAHDAEAIGCKVRRVPEVAVWDEGYKFD